MAASHHINSGKVAECIEDAQIAFAGDQEYAVDLIGGEDRQQGVGGSSEVHSVRLGKVSGEDMADGACIVV